MRNSSADGLRGLAAFNVVLTHFVAAFLPALLHKNYPTIFAANPAPGRAFDLATAPLSTLFYNGQFSVLIFFVLSGYVLAMPYFEGDPAALKRRLLGRFVRLNIPVAAATALAFAFYRLGLFANLPAAARSGSTVWLASFYPAGIPAAGALGEALYGTLLHGDASLIAPLWTLKIEFIGSLYLLLFYLAKPRRLTVLPALFAGVLLYAVHQADSIFYIAIFAGSLLHAAPRAGRVTPLLLALGCYFGAYQFESAYYAFLPGVTVWGNAIWEVKTFYNCIGAVCLAAAVLAGAGRRLLDSRPVQCMGRLSFSVYLLHFVILCSLACRVYLLLPHSGWALALNLALYLCACVLAAALFEKLVDRPAIRLSHRFASLVVAPRLPPRGRHSSEVFRELGRQRLFETRYRGQVRE